jgi:hypothetical protein
MRKWLTAFLLVVSILGGAIGVGAHEGEGSMAGMPDCCKKAQSTSGSPQVSMARLCCNLNCSEPGSSGSSSSSSLSTQQTVTPQSAVLLSAPAFGNIRSLGRYSQAPRPNDSNPKYIQHLALLI